MPAILRRAAILCALVMLVSGPSAGLPVGPIGLPIPDEVLVIVVNRSNPVTDLSSAELRRIFMLERQSWPHGRKITVVLREKGQPERATAIAVICHLSEAEYERHVLFQTFRGSVGWGPRSILSASAMQRFVYDAPGAIGVVGADEADDSIKVLRIDGHLPADPRYPLRRRAPREPSKAGGVHP